MTDFWIYALIPVNVILIILFFCTLATSMFQGGDSAEKAWTVISGLFVALIISCVILNLNKASVESGQVMPARPFAALGLTMGSCLIWLLGTATLWFVAFLESRKEMKDQIAKRVEEIMKKKAKETDEILRRHGV